MAGYAFGNGLTLDPSAEFEKGAQQRKESQLGRLLGQAYNAAPSERGGILGQVAQIDAGRAFDAQRAFSDQDASRLQGLGKKAAMVVAAARSGNKQMAASMYPQLVQEASAVFGPSSLSPQWDDSQLGPLEAFAQAMNPQQAPEQFTLAPGSTRYDASGKVVASQPFSPQRPQLYDDGQGNVSWVAPPQAGGGMGAVDTSSGHPNQDLVMSAANRMAAAGVPSDQIDSWVQEQLSQPVSMGAPPAPMASSGVTPIPGLRGKTPQAQEAFAPLTSDEIQQMGLPAGTVAQRNLRTQQVQVLSKPDARQGTAGVTPLSAGEAAKVRTNFKETREALGMFQALDQALKDVPGGIGTALDPEKRGRLGTSYNNARSALRILYNTGVLQPGELPMLEEALRNPASYGALIDPRTRPQLRGQLDELYRTVDRGIKNQVASYPQIFDPQKYEASRAKRSQQGGGLAPGAVQDGYRFKGGDPANPNSWEKI